MVVKKQADSSKSKKTSKSTATPLSHGVGRRKRAVARVWLRKGNGSVVVNGKDYKAYFDTDISRQNAIKPFEIAPEVSIYNVDINVQGGGLSAQAGAVKLGIARALVVLNETMKPVLKKHGLLTVDDRQVERKKYGRRKARRSFQFVKR